MPLGEARSKAPHLFPDIAFSRTPGGPPVMFPNVFSCRHFDPDTRLCTNWENRPPTCRDFPRYGLPKVHPIAVLPQDCEYRVDQNLPVVRHPPTEEPTSP